MRNLLCVIGRHEWQTKYDTESRSFELCGRPGCYHTRGHSRSNGPRTDTDTGPPPPFQPPSYGPALAMGVAGLAVGWAEVRPASTGTLMLATFFADTTRHVRGVGAVLEVAFKGRR
jgi:hypothetical protein